MHDTLRQPGSSPLRPPPFSGGAARRLRAIFGGLAVASILTAAVGCDKHADGETAPPKLQTSLAGKPTVLFLLFGGRDDARLLPVATIGHGRVTPITLDADGWRKFDALYFKAGSQLAVYRQGATLGAAVVRRGMWEGDAPLYKLPGCKALRPLAAVDVPGSASADAVALELLATSDPLPSSTARPDVPAALSDTARELTARIAGREGLTPTERAGLALTVAAFHTGVTARPTLMGSYLDRAGSATTSGRHLFVLADSAASGRYEPSFVYVAKDSAPEFRRLIDHADLTGDGVDEIVLEGWTAGGDSFLVILRYEGGRWKEVARGEKSWCADVKAG